MGLDLLFRGFFDHVWPFLKAFWGLLLICSRLLAGKSQWVVYWVSGLPSQEVQLAGGLGRKGTKLHAVSRRSSGGLQAERLQLQSSLCRQSAGLLRVFQP